MALKITDMTALTGDNVATDDVIENVDVSATTNKKITIAELVDAISRQVLARLTLAPGASVADPAANGQVNFELTSDTTFTIQAKGSDGTVRTGTVTLS